MDRINARQLPEFKASMEEIRASVLKYFGPEERLEGLEPAERLTGLKPEDLETLRAILK